MIEQLRSSPSYARAFRVLLPTDTTGKFGVVLQWALRFLSSLLDDYRGDSQRYILPEQKNVSGDSDPVRPIPAGGTRGHGGTNQVCLILAESCEVH